MTIFVTLAIVSCACLDSPVFCRQEGCAQMEDAKTVYLNTREVSSCVSEKEAQNLKNNPKASVITMKNGTRYTVEGTCKDDL